MWQWSWLSQFWDHTYSGIQCTHFSFNTITTPHAGSFLIMLPWQFTFNYDDPHASFFKYSCTKTKSQIAALSKKTQTLGLLRLLAGYCTLCIYMYTILYSQKVLPWKVASKLYTSISYLLNNWQKIRIPHLYLVALRVPKSTKAPTTINQSSLIYLKRVFFS